MKILYWTGWALSRALFKTGGGLRIFGQDNIPKTGGFLLASNHISYFDPPLIGSCTSREVYFFGKRELFRNPLFGQILVRVNTLPVKRGVVDRQAIKTSIDIIRKGYGLTFFPEGTRSKTGKLLPPRPGLGLIATQAQCPIVPSVIVGSNQFRSCMVRKNRIIVRFGEPFPADWVKSFNHTKESYREISQAVMARIAELRDSLLAQD
ncbi:MAG: lysophospholipid acyltransferase family protein [candidate division Zixibacteria bacterium]|nr:lysophospholipid acyltransferase family protein [candidate division Zixibacteria bacterium]